MKNTITQKYIRNYLTENYGEIRHNVKRLAIACIEVGKIYGYTPKQIFHFMIEQVPVDRSHSYGFNTAYGRDIREEFEVQYYGMYKEIKK